MREWAWVGASWGSAGSVLRSQGTLGPAELSRCRERGIRMSTFQCSLRPGPAAAWRILGCPVGSGLRREALEKVRRSECPNGAPHTSPGLNPGYGVPTVRSEGTPHTLVLPPVLRWPSAGAGAEDHCLDEAPRDRSCARRERWDRLSYRAAARWGSGCRRSNARSGPVPLPLGGSVVGLALGVSRGWELRGISPALAGKLGGGWGFRAVREGEV